MEDPEYEEKLLPITISSRIIKEQLPEGVIITKQLKKLMNLSTGLFVSYVAAVAGEIAKDTRGRKKKAIISTIHIIKALEELNFSSISTAISSTFPVFTDD